MKKNDVKVGASYVAKVSGRLARVRIERESPYGGWDAVNADTGRRVRIKSAQRLRREAIDPKRAKAIAAADQENARLRDERERSPDGMTASERAMAQSAVATATAVASAAEAEGPADAGDPDVCATVGCGRPASLTYLGRPRCQECYEDDVADGDEIAETPNHEETDMVRAKKTRKSTKKQTKITKTPKPEPKAAKPAGDGKPKRISALDAAAQVLADVGKPMRAKELIETMATRGLWTSPNGKTPEATLYAAMLREINQAVAGGKVARFRKADRGLFEFNAAAKVEA